MKRRDELDLPGEGVPEPIVERAKRILKLLEKVTSLTVVAEFLRGKELHHSAGSWQDLEEKRIVPALRSRKITLEDLNQLLAESEEYGRSHIFLYQTAKNDAERCMDSNHVAKTCERLKIEDALREIVVEELPDAPKITQVRREDRQGRTSWVFKIVEKREQKRLIGESVDGNTYTRKYQIESVRAVNVAKLHETGTLEIRIQSRLRAC